jgi:predicted lipoprotein with Yx(FWY)xxD motif
VSRSLTLRRTAVMLVLLLTTACGGAADTGGDTGGDTATQPSASSEAPAASTAQPTPTAAPSSPAAAAGIGLTTAGSEFGEMLFDARGQAIYLFDRETAGRPDCYGECAVAWPPVLSAGPPQAAGAVRAELLGTVIRDDGSTQVTYNGHPLYFYAHESPGQVLCHDVVEFGGRWLVVTPEGAAAA